MKFDIFETVHLADNLGGIEQIVTISMHANISAKEKGKHVQLFGCLFFSGEYTDGDGDTNQIEHTIPVEIMIPNERVNKVEDLVTGIQNVKVSIVSRRTIRITGVLQLGGVNMVLPKAIESDESAQAQAGGRIGGSYE